tara:strand:- start:3843 stop:4109 length:267 start_codon:yes stop_codon:yes gene_type:complete
MSTMPTMKPPGKAYLVAKRAKAQQQEQEQAQQEQAQQRAKVTTWRKIRVLSRLTLGKRDTPVTQAGIALHEAEEMGLQAERCHASHIV